MTAQQFKEIVNKRYVASTYEVDNNDLLIDVIIPGITQCLINQEMILKKLSENDFHNKH